MSHTSHNYGHCAHTRLSFCQVCQVVYCHGCDQEWAPKATCWWTTTGYGGSLGDGERTNQYPHGTVLCETTPHTHGG